MNNNVNATGMAVANTSGSHGTRGPIGVVTWVIRQLIGLVALVSTCSMSLKAMVSRQTILMDKLGFVEPGDLEMRGQANNLSRDPSHWNPIDQGGMGPRDRVAWVAGYMGANVVGSPRSLVSSIPTQQEPKEEPIFFEEIREPVVLGVGSASPDFSPRE